MKFNNRIDAGKKLAPLLASYKDAKHTLLLALPRGGVPVAATLAGQLHLPFDLWLVRKLGVPGHEELAMGAIALGNTIVFNEHVLNQLSIPQEMMDGVIAKEKKEIAARNLRYRNGNPPPDVKDKTVILIDDGLATGATMRAAIASLRMHHPQRIVVAIPVAAPDSLVPIQQEADEVICLYTPGSFSSVGQWYHDFSQTTDEEVKQYFSPS